MAIDTQWPRFEVFKQDEAGALYQNVGTVHAADAEIALLNARDVYGRRPSCHSLWVAPESAILKVTAEELSSPKMQALLAGAKVEEAGQTRTYRVFQKVTQKRSMTYVNYIGEVEAVSPVGALAKALERFGEGQTWVWWVCPAGAITASEPGVEESWFAPANDKVYRQQSYYGKVKRKRLDERRELVQQLSQPEKGQEVAR